MYYEYLHFCLDQDVKFLCSHCVSHQLVWSHYVYINLDALIWNMVDSLTAPGSWINLDLKLLSVHVSHAHTIACGFPPGSLVSSQLLKTFLTGLSNLSLGVNVSVHGAK